MNNNATEANRAADIARTILDQLGGGRFVAMTGAKTLAATGKGLQFRLPSRKINLVSIDLNYLDLYDMKFQKINWKTGVSKIVSEHNGIYFDQLVPIFEKETGLYTSL